MANTIQNDTEYWETRKAQTIQATQKTSKVTGTADNETDSSDSASTAVRTDTVELSSGARAALSRQQTTVQSAAKTNTDNTAQNLVASTATDSLASTDASAQAAQQMMSTGTGNSSSSTENTNDLSSYTVDELDDMLDEGTITQSEYNAEIAKRKQESEASSENTDESDLEAMKASLEED